MAIRDMSLTDLRNSAEILDEFCQELAFEQSTLELVGEVRNMTVEERERYCREHGITPHRGKAAFRPFYN